MIKIDENLMIPNKFEPKRKFRWIAKIDGIEPFLVKSVERPCVEIRRWPLRNKIKDFNIVLYDAIGFDATEQILSWINKNNCRSIVITLVDAVGKIIEELTFDKVKLLKANFGNLDYSSNDTCTITLDMRCCTFNYTRSVE